MFPHEVYTSSYISSIGELMACQHEVYTRKRRKAHATGVTFLAKSLGPNHGNEVIVNKQS